MYGDMFTRLIDYFAIHTNIESLCCTAGTNRMFYVNSTSKKKKGKGHRPIKIHATMLLNIPGIMVSKKK